MTSFDLSNLQTLPSGYSLMQSEMEDEEGEVYDMSEEEPIGASLDVALLPAGLGTERQDYLPNRSTTLSFQRQNNNNQIARANVSRTDGIDEISPKMRSLYQLYRMLSGAARRGNHGFFVKSSAAMQAGTAVEQNDSILEEVRLYGNLQERTASFVADLQNVEEAASSSSSAPSSLSTMTEEEVINGLQEGSITFDSQAEHALLKAAYSTQTQFRKNFPEEMNYPKDLEAWMLAMGRKPITLLPFIDIAFAFYNETGMQDISISKTSTSIEANVLPVRGAASNLITEPVKSQVLKNLAAVTGQPFRIRKNQIELSELTRGLF